MDTTALQLQLALTHLQGIGPRKARQMLSKLHGYEEIFELGLRELAERTGISQNVLKNMDRNRALFIASKSVENIVKYQSDSLFIADANYPRRLKQCDDAPLLLFKKGKRNLNEGNFLSVVGTRTPTPYGLEVCEQLIRSLRGTNTVVVSGLAYGIDVHVHRLCLKYEVPTIGVLGHGLDRIYPAIHRRTAEEMLQNGALCTEFVPFTNPDRENFPKRNRIVAGMCDATVVIESKSKGGSLITASLANDYNRDVFAVPGRLGDEFSEGCNWLIRKNQAHPFLGVEDFLKLMNWNGKDEVETVQTNLFNELTPEETLVCRCIEEKGVEHIDVISIKTRNPISKTSVLLFNLELAGIVRALPGNRYKLMA